MEETKTAVKTAKKADNAVIKTMFEAGAHYGYSKSSRHPSVLKYIFGFKNKSAIIDLEKTALALEKAKNAVIEQASEGTQMIFVGNKPEARKIIKSYAEKAGMPYVAERWMGGTFTNFKQIRRRVERLQEIRADEESGELMRKYKKKERMKIAKEKQDLERYFDGIVDMEKIPALMFAIDAKSEKIAIDEARALGVTTVALCSSDCDIRNIDYPIVANDSSIASIKFFTEEITKAFLEGKKLAAQKAATKAEEEKTPAGGEEKSAE